MAKCWLRWRWCMLAKLYVHAMHHLIMHQNDYSHDTVPCVLRTVAVYLGLSSSHTNASHSSPQSAGILPLIYHYSTNTIQQVILKHLDRQICSVVTTTSMTLATLICVHVGTLSDTPLQIQWLENVCS